MSLLGWLFPKKTTATAQRAGQAVQRQTPSAPANNPGRSERTQRREQLYLAVRDAMVRSGVLSSAYKFKVLSLDPQGLQFLVMIDIAPANGSDVARQREMAALLTQFARTRFHIDVVAVYWRVQETLGAPGLANAATPAPNAAIPIAPRPLRPVSTPPIVASPVHPAPVVAPAVSGFEPIAPDEVAAFKQALQKTTSVVATSTAMSPRRPVSAFPEPEHDSESDGFADTVIAEDDGYAPPLGPTQYGNLR